MNGSTQTTPVYIITFNLDEATWLQGYMQNQKDPVELPGDAENRQHLFDLLAKLTGK